MSVDLYAAIWKNSGTPAWQARFGLTAANFQSTFNTLNTQGYRLTCVSGYEFNGQALYAAIWDQTSGAAWQARFGLTSAEYQTTFDQLGAPGVPASFCQRLRDQQSGLLCRLLGSVTRRSLASPPRHECRHLSDHLQSAGGSGIPLALGFCVCREQLRLLRSHLG